MFEVFVFPVTFTVVPTTKESATVSDEPTLATPEVLNVTDWT